MVIPLLKGVVYREHDDALWNGLTDGQAQVRDYVAVLGLELVLDEAEGYAFLRSRTDGEMPASTDAGGDMVPEGSRLPRLVVRQPLSFHVSLLLALLRRKLAEFDAGGGRHPAGAHPRRDRGDGAGVSARHQQRGEAHRPDRLPP